MLLNTYWMKPLCLIVIALVALAGCNENDVESVTSEAPIKAPSSAFANTPYVNLKTPDWAKNAAIYQINTRQFTPEGTFKAAQKRLPELKALGVDILWLMPIHPIGVEKRKGSLGSPYAVKDPIVWQPHPIGALYQRGFQILKDNPALWHGIHGATMIRVYNSLPDSVFSFV